jgi:hypothetical protein
MISASETCVDEAPNKYLLRRIFVSKLKFFVSILWQNKWDKAGQSDKKVSVKMTKAIVNQYCTRGFKCPEQD